MISKDRFYEIIKRLKNYTELQEKINELFKNQLDNMENDFTNAGSICIGHESVVADLLDNMFETDMVSWWIYEADYGKTFKVGDVVEIDRGYKPDLSTSDKLYDYLMHDYNSNNMKTNLSDTKIELLQQEIDLQNKIIDAMAEDLKTPINSKEWVKKYYKERTVGKNNEC